MRRLLGRHWETLVLLAVAVLCAVSVAQLGSPTPPIAPSSSSIPGLTGPDVEKAAAAANPGAESDVSVVSGRRSVTYTVEGSSGVAGSITVSSVVSGGAVTRVQCGAYSTPSRPLTVAGDAILTFCATLPATGAGTDTVGWIDQQFAAAAVGYSKTQNHSGIQYDLSYSQYSNDRTRYEIAVLPSFGT